MTALTEAEEALVSSIVNRYIAELDGVEHFRSALYNTLTTRSPLTPLIHSVRSRVKDPEHLRKKLVRKLTTFKTAGQPLDVAPDNLFAKINDLAAIRLLHLHTAQIAEINVALQDRLAEYHYRILEGPIAYIWDSEYEQFFQDLGISTAVNERMYTSVHYVIEENSRTHRTAEVQVRTLAEELWGEVDHAMNYPEASTNATCRDQIRVLARLTSGCTRLVESIFRSSASRDQ